MENILEVNNIYKIFNNFRLENIRFNLPKGYIMGLVGPNGAGKTTIIKAILNAVNINSGTIKVFDLDSKNDETAIKSRLGYISDKIYFSEFWTANDINTIMKKIHSTWNSTKFKENLKKYKLPSNKPVKEFSGGMQTRLMLSAVFSRETDLLVLDEPTSGLDPVMRDEFLALIKEYIKDGEKSVLYSTHITTDLEKNADFITFIDDGHLVFSEETDALKESYYIVKDSLNTFDRVKSTCIGIRKNEFGFEALITSDSLNSIPETCIRQPASIDEIIIFYSLKGARTHGH